MAVVVGESCVRARPFVQALRRQRSGAHARVEAWPGLRELVEAGRDGARARRLVERHVAALRGAGVGAVALGCAHAAAVAPLVAEAGGTDLAVVGPEAVLVERVRLALRGHGLVVHGRRRSGRVLVLSSDPARAAGLAAALPGLRARPGG